MFRSVAASLLFLPAVSQATLKVGDPAPPIQVASLLQAPPGAQATLRALHGKVIVLEFWATWCGPCIANIPHLNDVVASVDASKIQFISVDDEDAAKVKKFLASHTMGGWVAVDTPGQTTFKNYGVDSRPTTIVIDARGRIASITRADQLTAEGLMALAAHAANSPSAAKPPRAAAERAQAPASTAQSPATLPTPANTSVVSNDPAKALGGGSLFQVSISPTKDTSRAYFHDDSGFVLVGFPAGDLIRFGYSAKANRTTFDPPLSDDRYSLALVGIPESMKAELLQAAVRQAFHVEVKQVKAIREVYVLKSVLGGAIPTRSSPEAASNQAYTAGKLYLVHAEMDDLALQLESQCSDPVVNETGLPGFYDMTLSFPEHDTAAIQQALRGVGLQLTRETREISVYAVKPSPTISDGKPAIGGN